MTLDVCNSLARRGIHQLVSITQIKRYVYEQVSRPAARKRMYVLLRVVVKAVRHTRIFRPANRSVMPVRSGVPGR